MFYNPMDVSRIDRQIEELQRLKNNYQSMQQPQQPINNIITSQPVQQQPMQPIFEAKFTTDNPADVIIQNKTAFINLKGGKLSIKDTDGKLEEYEIILPKDEKDLRIEELETKMKNLEISYNTLLQNVTINNHRTEPTNSVVDNSIETALTNTTNTSNNFINDTENIVEAVVSEVKPTKKGFFKK